MKSFSITRVCLVLLLARAAGLTTYAQVQPEDLALAAHAEELARSGQTVEAEQIVAAYLHQHPGSVPVNVVAGELQSFRRQWAPAMAYFEAALRTNPADGPARRGEREAATALALHQRDTQQAEAALATLEHARLILPDDLPVLLNTALQAQSMHRLKTAQAAISAALALDAHNQRVQYAAAGIDFDRGDFVGAAAHYRDFLASRPEDASAHYGLGRALRMQQQLAEAQKEFQRSIELQPVQTEAYYQLGEIALQSGRYEEARADYQKTLSRMPTHGGALTGMGMLAYRAHDYASAKASLEEAVSAAPDYQPAHYYLGLTLRRLGDTSASERELNLATELAAKQQGKGVPIAAQ